MNFLLLQVSPIATMSPETWHFSFAKYLELRFYGHAYCRRQLPISSAPVSCACVIRCIRNIFIILAAAIS